MTERSMIRQPLRREDGTLDPHLMLKLPRWACDLVAELSAEIVPFHKEPDLLLVKGNTLIQLPLDKYLSAVCQDILKYAGVTRPCDRQCSVLSPCPKLCGF